MIPGYDFNLFAERLHPVARGFYDDLPQTLTKFVMVYQWALELKVVTASSNQPLQPQ